MSRLIYDIETLPGPLEVIEPLFEPFKPNSGWKDAVKIERARQEYIQDCIDDAALNPLTGVIACIGVHEGDGEEKFVMDGDGEEELLIMTFWQFIEKPQYTLVGFNSHNFDLPYLVRRSWILGVPVPTWLRKGRYWTDRSIDLREVWQLGDRSAKGSLGSICKALGLGEKTGEGKDFHRLWTSDRAKAMEYTLNDVRLTAALAKRLGI